MSRHRDVRCMNYSDEYDGYDDVYGHSVEDDYCTSPSVEQFMFDRNKQANIASFFTEPDIVEDNEEADDITSTYKLPQLSELDTAKLLSCVEAIKHVIGNTHSESELNKKIIEFNYDTEAVLNSILNKETIRKEKISEKQTEEQSVVNTQSDSKSENLFSGNISRLSFNKSNIDLSKRQNLKNDNDNNNRAQAISQNNHSLNSLADLSAHFLNIDKQNPNSSSEFLIPKMSFNSSNSSTNDDLSPSFSSLADLTAHHLKISTKSSVSNVKKINSPSGFLIPKFSSSFNKSNQLNSPFHSSAIDDNLLPEFITPKKCSDYSKLDTCIIPPSNFLTQLKKRYDLKTEKNSDLKDNITVPNLDVKIKQEKHTKQNNLEGISNTVLEDISNLILETKLDSNQLKTELQVSNIDKLIIKQENLKKDIKSIKKLNRIESIHKECILNSIIYSNNYKLSKKIASPFGKVLCKCYKKKMPYPGKEGLNLYQDNVLRFNFACPSPDNIVMAKRLRTQTKESK